MTDRRLIEAGFPCHQVGAETARERGASSALPPLYFLHVWWARRPLTPSRAAIAGSLAPYNTDVSDFVRSLGIEHKCALVEGDEWILTGDLLDFIQKDENSEFIEVDSKVVSRFLKEIKRRETDRQAITQLRDKLKEEQQSNEIIEKWEALSRPFNTTTLHEGEKLIVIRKMADPAWFNRLMDLAKNYGVRVPNLYGYDRAYQNDFKPTPTGFTVLDPTSGGGSIPFEALRLGHNVIANELNPVASTILHATLDFPARFGESLYEDIKPWGEEIVSKVSEVMEKFNPSLSYLIDYEKQRLIKHLVHCPEFATDFDKESVTTYLYCRQITCPSCYAKTPLLNTFWLSKQAKDQWGVKVVISGQGANASYRFETYQAKSGKGPNGEDPELGTIKNGIGQCIHCKQAIDGNEIKAQARGESNYGKWKDELFAVVATRLQPKLNKSGKPQYFSSGARKGEIKTEKIRFFRSAHDIDKQAIDAAEEYLQSHRESFEDQGLIPIEPIPEQSNYNRGHRLYGVTKWSEMFTPRQLLSHAVAARSLKELKSEIIQAYGFEKAKAIITYLQFSLNKILDYNSTQTRWEYTRGVIKGTFSRHNFSVQWTFGEMISSGPNSGYRWGLSQVLDAYSAIQSLSKNVANGNGEFPLRMINGSAAHMIEVENESVDLVCMDPPYYDNVMYGELSDFFYVWNKRSLKELYPDLYIRRLVNKQEEAVANIALEGSKTFAKEKYESLMSDIFLECRRVVKSDGLMTLMFTHKAQDAWETLTRSLIQSGWEITSCFPVESESGHSTHQMNLASAASTIFITCRKRAINNEQIAFWSGLGGSGIQHQIRSAVETGLDEFKPLKLNAVDQMIACYGRALQVLSENWPVMDGDDEVSPLRAMNEASQVVAANQIAEITEGRISVDDLDTETAMALTIYGIWGHNDIAFSEVLNLSRSLNISLETRTGGYAIESRMVGINADIGSRRAAAGQAAEDKGYAAPLIKSGSKLRLAKPEERSVRRLGKPQSDWDVLHGMLLKYREGDVPVARAYLDEKREGNDGIILDLLEVWGEEAETPEARNEARALLFGLRQ